MKQAPKTTKNKAKNTPKKDKKEKKLSISKKDKVKGRNLNKAVERKAIVSKKKRSDLIDKIDEIGLKEAKELIPIDLTRYKLEAKEIRFISLYILNEYDDWECVKRAGYKLKQKRALENTAHRLLNQNNVKNCIKEIFDLFMSPFQFKIQQSIIKMWWNRAFYPIEVFYYNNGRIKPLTKIEARYRMCIDGIERSGYNAAEVSYKLANRSEAINKLWQYVEKLNKSGEGSGFTDQEQTDIMKEYEDFKAKKNNKILEFKKAD